MRVAITRRGLITNLDGVNRFCAYLAEGLKRMGHEVFIVSRGFYGVDREGLSKWFAGVHGLDGEIPVYTIKEKPRHGGPWTKILFDWWFRGSRILKELGADIVVVNGAVPLRFKPKVAVAHGIHERTSYSQRLILKALYGMYDYVVCVSKASEEEYKGITRCDKIIPLPFKTSLYTPKPLEHRSNIVVHVGTAPRKNPQVSVEAVRILRERGLDVKLIFVGARSSLVEEFTRRYSFVEALFGIDERTKAELHWRLLRLAFRKPTKLNILRLLAYPLVKAFPSLRMLIVIVAEKVSNAESVDVKVVLSAVLLSLVMNMLRFFYTTAYLGAGTYWHELLRFLTYCLQAATREPQWSAPQIPRITSYSFTVLPAMALTPLLLYILSKVYERMKWQYIDSHYLTHLLAGGTMLLMGLLASTFSNSLSRELGYPGFIVITISAAYTLRYIEERDILRVVFALIAAIAYTLSLFTPSINPWLYLSSNPIPSYTPTTYEGYLVAEAIISRYGLGSLYVESIYSIPTWYSAFTRGITVLQTSSQAGSLIFNSNIAEVWWS